MLALTSCRDAHPGRPYLAVLGTTLGPITRHRDTDRITPYMPDYDQQSEKQKDSKMPHLLYTKLPHFAMFVRKFYFGPYFTH